MTVLRRYVFAVLAMCTALAIGVALGGGPLQGNFVDVNADGASGRSSPGAAAAAAQRSSRLDTAVASAATHRLLRDQLAGRSVAVVVLPGVAHSTVTGLIDALQQAGGLTPVVARLSGDLVDPAKKTYVDSVATSSLKHRPDLAVQAGDDTFERIGAVLARAYVGTAAHSTFDSEASGIDAEMQGARLVTLDAPPVRRGTLLMVIAPQIGSRGQYAAASRVISAELIMALAASSDGAVLVSVGSDDDAPVTQGWPVRLRSAAALSTLNVATGPASRVAAVYALQAAAHGRPGSFGVFGHSVALPPGLVDAGS